MESIPYIIVGYLITTYNNFGMHTGMIKTETNIYNILISVETSASLCVLYIELLVLLLPIKEVLGYHSARITTMTPRMCDDSSKGFPIIKV